MQEGGNGFPTLCVKTEALENANFSGNLGAKTNGDTTDTPTTDLSSSVVAAAPSIYKSVLHELKFKKVKKNNVGVEAETVQANEIVGAPKEAKKRRQPRTRAPGDPPAKKIKLEAEPTKVVGESTRRGDIPESGNDVSMAQAAIGGRDDQTQAELLTSLSRMSVAAEGPLEPDKLPMPKQKKPRKSAKKQQLDDMGAGEDKMPEGASQADNPPKAKRGRPRKNQKLDNMGADEDKRPEGASQADNSPKAKRGRPRKNQKLEDVETDHEKISGGMSETNNSSKAKQKKPRQSIKNEKVEDVGVKDEKMDEKPLKPVRAKKAVTGGTRQKKNAPLALGEPRWTLAKTRMPADVKSHSSLAGNDQVKPKIWCGSKEELLAAQPELSKWTNNITWLMSHTPVILLENQAEVMVSDLAVDKLSFDLKMSRNFACLPGDLGLPASNQKSAGSLRLRGGAASPPPRAPAFHQYAANSAHSYQMHTGYPPRNQPGNRHQRNLNSAPRDSYALGLSSQPYQRTYHQDHEPVSSRNSYAPGPSSQPYPKPYRQDHELASSRNSYPLEPSSQHYSNHYRRDYDGTRSDQRGTSRSHPSSRYNPMQRRPSPSSYYPSNPANRGLHPPRHSSQYHEHQSTNFPPSFSNNRAPSHRYVQDPPFPSRARHRDDYGPARSEQPSVPQGPRAAGYWGPDPGPGHLRHPQSSVDHFEHRPGEIPRMVPSSSGSYTTLDPRRQLDGSSGDTFDVPLPVMDRNARPPMRRDLPIESFDINPKLPSLYQVTPTGNALTRVEETLPLRDVSPRGILDTWKIISSQGNTDSRIPNFPSSYSHHHGSFDGVSSGTQPRMDYGPIAVSTNASGHFHRGNDQNSSMNARPQADYEMRPANSSIMHQSFGTGAVGPSYPVSSADSQHYISSYHMHNQADGVSSLPQPISFNGLFAFGDEDLSEMNGTMMSTPTQMDVGVRMGPPRRRSPLPAYLDPLEYNYTVSLSDPPSDDMVPPDESNIWETSPVKAEDATELEPDKLIPSGLPPEIDVVCNSYVGGIPVVFIASRSFLAQRWGLSIPEECGVAYLGYFKITSVQEQRLELPQVASDTDTVYGSVEWRFTFTWIPDGEDAEQSEASKCYPQPWWASSTALPLPHSEFVLKPPDEDFSQTSLHYGTRRKQSPNYALRQIPLYKLYRKLLPLFLYAAPADGSRDSVVPTGWFCSRCGRVNVQDHLRHRICRSSLCKNGKAKQKATETETDEPDGQHEAFAVPLELLRDPNQASPLSHPVNHYPLDLVEGMSEDWSDGMQTYIYSWKGRSKPGKKPQGTDKIEASLTHVFTGNADELQNEAVDLLRDFQLHVPLKRKMGSTSPYFSYVAGTDRSGVAVPWMDVPKCVTRARDLLISRISYYVEREIKISRLSTYAWVTTGRRKGNETLAATKHPVVLMALGCEVCITFVPKSGFRELPVVEAPTAMLLPATDWEGDILMGDKVPLSGMAQMVLEDDQERAIPQGVAGPSDAPEDDIDPDGAAEDIFADQDHPQEEEEVPKKGNKQSLMITLVHGDAVMLSGDNFEYSIKRLGTSILLVGSTVE